MRTLVRLAAPVFCLAALLAACGLERPAPAPAVLPAAPPVERPVPAFSTEAVANELNILVNDTVPGDPEYDPRRTALAPAANAANLPDDLRRCLAAVLAFDPPRLQERWERHQQAQQNAATLYAANPPVDTAALNGGRVLRRLGPALFLVRLPGGDTALLQSGRKFKKNARIKQLYVLEREHAKPDAAKGDLVDELEEQPRTFVEISRQEARELEQRRAPALAELRRLESEGAELERGVTADLARLDILARDVNAVIGPMLLAQGPHPAPTGLIRSVTRMAKNFSRDQYYRYALPVTGLPKVDAELKGFLDERKAEVLSLLKSTGVGRGRVRANADRIAFTAHTASPVLLSFRFEEMRDTGGAHPNTIFASFVFDLRDQSRLRLADLFTDEAAALSVLSDLAQRRLTLALDGLLFAEGFAPKAENFTVFVLDGADIVFTFPPYQVASYAQGPQNLRVPLFHPRLSPLLSPRLKAALAAGR
ncbi:Protein of unknown function [Humidesulfovibrio mexicanus]|uniref:DUF3298 domain-containing protein n=1 Tax=Humidesulfovibrio mexicanus TaxID=147047 RepID=A0A238YZG0_9BACT|nr:DUF3298 and DUF4163 domain-containing protein [Humidesulfovibrio mexicanus]SNR76098.1 Protein of unknown function [Humidesulfovibrio mexicanus]